MARSIRSSEPWSPSRCWLRAHVGVLISASTARLGARLEVPPINCRILGRERLAAVATLEPSHRDSKRRSLADTHRAAEWRSSCTDRRHSGLLQIEPQLGSPTRLTAAGEHELHRARLCAERAQARPVYGAAVLAARRNVSDVIYGRTLELHAGGRGHADCGPSRLTFSGYQRGRACQSCPP